MDRVLPQAQEIERVVLGGALVDSNVCGLVLECCQLETWYNTTHREIYEQIRRLTAKGVTPDFLTIVNTLEAAGKAQAAEDVVDLAGSMCSEGDAEGYIKILKGKAKLRKLIEVNNQINQLAYSGEDPDEVLQEAEAKIYQCNEETTLFSEEPVGQIVPTALRHAEMVAQGQYTGITSGFKDVDQATGGFGDEFIVVAGRPGMGKTSFALTMALRQAQLGYPALYFSLEMSKLQLMQRLLCIVGKANLFHLRTGRLDTNSYLAVKNAAKEIEKLPLYIDDYPYLDIRNLRSKLRRMVRRYSIATVYIDHIGLMQGPGKTTFDVVSEISRQLKLTSREVKTPVIGLSQLSRELEKRKGRNGKKPILSDLRSSGSLEQDADMVMFVYRDEKYFPYNPEKDKIDNRGQADIIIAKQRQGPETTLPFKFEKETTAFRETDDGGEW